MYYFGPSVKLTDFRMGDAADDGTYVVLSGEIEGIWNLLMSFMGLGSTLKFEVTDSEVKLEEARLLACINRTVPIKNVSMTSYGFSRNVVYIALIILAVIATIAASTVVLQAPQARGAGLGAAMFLLLVGSVAFLLFVVLYIGSKRLGIAVESQGGSWIRLRIRPGYVGSRVVGLREVGEVVDIITDSCAKK